MFKQLLKLQSEMINKFNSLENDITLDDTSVTYTNSFTCESCEVNIVTITSTNLISEDGDLIKFEDIGLLDLAYLCDHYL